MGKLRVVVYVSVAFGALALAAPALAGYGPRLSVTSQSQKLGGTGVNIKFNQAGNDDPTARLGVSIPKGYALTASRSPGARIGAVSANVIAPDARRTVRTSGPLVVANASDFAGEAQSCTGSASPSAVWSFTLAVAGQSFRVPVFVDTTVSGPAGQFAAASLTICLAAGDTPRGTPGRALLGSKITNLVISTKGITSPKETGIYRWRASATPYTAGTGSPNLKGIVEVQSLVPIPLELTLSAKVGPSSRAGYSRVTLSGALEGAGQSAPGIFVVLKRGTSARGLKQLGVLSTNRGGEFGAKGDVKRTGRPQRMYFQVTTGPIEKDLGEAGCQATVSTVRCIDATLPYNVSSPKIAVTIPA